MCSYNLQCGVFTCALRDIPVKEIFVGFSGKGDICGNHITKLVIITDPRGANLQLLQTIKRKAGVIFSFYFPFQAVNIFEVHFQDNF